GRQQRRRAAAAEEQCRGGPPLAGGEAAGQGLQPRRGRGDDHVVGRRREAQPVQVVGRQLPVGARHPRSARRRHGDQDRLDRDQVAAAKRPRRAHHGRADRSLCHDRGRQGEGGVVLSARCSVLSASASASAGAGAGASARALAVGRIFTRGELVVRVVTPGASAELPSSTPDLKVRSTTGVVFASLLVFSFAVPAFAENGHDAWLRYAALPPAAAARAGAEVPRTIYRLGAEVQLARAEDELRKGVQGMLGRPLDPARTLPPTGAIVVGTLASIRASAPPLAPSGGLPPDAFSLRTVHQGNQSFTVIAGGDARGALYGAFAWLRKLSAGEELGALDDREAPYAPVRWVNQWDNIDGSIERGYGGRSVVWANGRVRDDLTKASEYGRLLASLGIGGVSINNVNANPAVLSPDFVPQIAKVADTMRPWGVRVAIAI